MPSGLVGSLQFGGALVHGFAQGLARLEMGDALFGNGHAFTAAGVATHAGRTVVDGEAAKAANLDAVPCNQCVVHGVQNGLDGKFGIAMGELAKPVGEFFNFFSGFLGCIFLTKKKRPVPQHVQGRPAVHSV
jgi:hypothetical protein